jgi:3-oxoacyl-[acyl-carrier protein] reductase
MGRIAQAKDVADVAAFLASSESDYLTGLAINVAGGSHMG